MFSLNRLMPCWEIVHEQILKNINHSVKNFEHWEIVVNFASKIDTNVANPWADKILRIKSHYGLRNKKATSSNFVFVRRHERMRWCSVSMI